MHLAPKDDATMFATANDANEIGKLSRNAGEASAFLKAMAHDGRLMILCHLVTGPRTVGELESVVPFRQAAVSQQLARLRLEGMVEAERDGKHLRYSLLDPRVIKLVGTLHEIFCADD
jgi:ArsR family transcriptional regulator